ncbi:MAG: hypothetical protein QF886_01025 [Planctomycetota bacterium]|nr:hypothetical protein [Planctomycetota bacterium]
MTIRWIVEFTHGQFAVTDSDAAGEPGDFGSESALSSRVVVSDCQTELTVLTARYGRYAKVLIDILDSEPSSDDSVWDHVVECNLNVPSGTIALWTTSGDTVFSAATRESEHAEISVEPALYRARIHFGNLAIMHKRLAETGHESSPLYYGGETIPSDEELDEMDYYHLMLWPVAMWAINILKQYPKAI